MGDPNRQVALCGENGILPADNIGCGKPILAYEKIYRCVDCSVPFHQHCAKRHFEKSYAAARTFTHDEVLIMAQREVDKERERIAMDIDETWGDTDIVQPIRERIGFPVSLETRSLPREVSEMNEAVFNDFVSLEQKWIERGDVIAQKDALLAEMAESLREMVELMDLATSLNFVRRETPEDGARGKAVAALAEYEAQKGEGNGK